MIIKNSNTRRSLYNNRYVIFVIIFAIIFFLYLIRTLNTNLQDANANAINNNSVTR